LKHLRKVGAACAGLKVLGTVDTTLPATVKGQEDREDSPAKMSGRGMADGDPSHVVFLAFSHGKFVLTSGSPRFGRLETPSQASYHTPLRNENKKLWPAPTLPYNKSYTCSIFCRQSRCRLRQSILPKRPVNQPQYFRRDENKSALLLSLE
jgi:hypothetical protein